MTATKVTAAKALMTALLSIALMACATKPASHYYSLAPQTPAPASGGAAADFAISVQPVVIPAQVDRPQIVLTDPDSTQVMLLNNSLWSGPLDEAIRNTLARDLSGRLGTLDIPVAGAPEGQAFWKVNLLVQRFESVYGQRAVLEATWRLSPVNLAQGKPLACRAVLSAQVGEGMSALVAGHQQNLLDLSAIIAAQLQGGSASADGRVQSCA